MEQLQTKLFLLHDVKTNRRVFTSNCYHEKACVLGLIEQAAEVTNYQAEYGKRSAVMQKSVGYQILCKVLDHSDHQAIRQS